VQTDAARVDVDIGRLTLGRSAEDARLFTRIERQER
jgi:hypothetical protein